MMKEIRISRFEIDDEDCGRVITYYFYNPENGQCIQVDSYDAPDLRMALIKQGYKIKRVEHNPPRTNNGNEERLMAFAKLVAPKTKQYG